VGREIFYFGTPVRKHLQEALMRSIRLGIIATITLVFTLQGSADNVFQFA